MENLLTQLETLLAERRGLEDRLDDLTRVIETIKDQLIEVMPTDSLTLPAFTLSKYRDLKIAKNAILEEAFYDLVEKQTLNKDRVLEYIDATGNIPGVDIVKKLRITTKRS